MKVALITGITGQDGSYLAEFLLKKGYLVHGIKRRSSSFNTSRIDHLFKDPHQSNVNLILHYGDLTDSTNLIKIIQQVQPDEIYNLAAQSHVKISFQIPEKSIYLKFKNPASRYAIVGFYLSVFKNNKILTGITGASSCAQRCVPLEKALENNFDVSSIPDKILDFPEAREYGNSEDKWVKNAEIYLNSLFDKNEVKETSIKTLNKDNDH